MEEGEMVEVVLINMVGDHLATRLVEPTMTGLQMKHMLEEEFGYPPTSQQLLFEAHIVEDEDLLGTLPQQVPLSLVLLPFDSLDALHRAVEEGREAAVRNLLFRVAHNSDETDDLLLADSDGRRVLQTAAVYGHAAICRVLLEAASNQAVRSRMLLAGGGHKGSGTALHIAAMKGHEMSCRTLADCATDLEVRKEMLLEGSFHDITALHYAAENGHEMACRALVEAAHDTELQEEMLEAVDYHFHSPLHFAAIHDSEICRVLLDLAPNVEKRKSMLLARNDRNEAAVHMAVSDVVRQALQQFARDLELPEELFTAKTEMEMLALIRRLRGIPYDASTCICNRNNSEIVGLGHNLHDAEWRDFLVDDTQYERRLLEEDREHGLLFLRKIQ